VPVRRSAWEAPNPRLTATALVTGWCWSDQIELNSGCGRHAVEDPASIEVGSGEVARRHAGEPECCDGGCAYAHGSFGERQGGAPGGWGWELRRMGSAGLVMAVLLGAWESVRRAYASSDAIVLHAVRGVVYAGRVVPTVPAGRSGAIGCTSHS
jgi:hypothetical protein